MTPEPTPLFAPAAARNREPLAAALGRLLPTRGRVLEVASGTGQHAEYFAQCFPRLEWQPSDVTPEHLASIEAYRLLARLPNLLPPLWLDVLTATWPELDCQAIFCANMIHIAPWAACEGLIKHASALLAPGQSLILYGPFCRDGVETAPSNLAFDRSLRARDASWGLRRLEDVAALAGDHGMRAGPVVEMPANNLTVVLYKAD